MTIRENEIIFDNSRRLTIRTGKERPQPGVIIVNAGDLRIQQRAIRESRPGRVDGDNIITTSVLGDDHPLNRNGLVIDIRNAELVVSVADTDPLDSVRDARERLTRGAVVCQRDMCLHRRGAACRCHTGHINRSTAENGDRKRAVADSAPGKRAALLGNLQLATSIARVSWFEMVLSNPDMVT